MDIRTSASRHVVRTLRGQAASDGAGVKLTRVIGQPALDMLDPFLLLDEFRSDRAADYLAGFPTAGRGIVHSEMPEQEDGLMWGFQLWVNLPASDKMTTPRYQDIAPERIPSVDAGHGARVRVLAGTFDGVTGPVSAVATEPVYLDIDLAAGSSITANLPIGHNAFAYVYEGAAQLGPELAVQLVTRGELAVLDRDGDALRVAAGDEPARLILVAGKPIGEPVARHGPFVMNTREQIIEAMQDFQAGRF